MSGGFTLAFKVLLEVAGCTSNYYLALRYLDSTLLIPNSATLSKYLVEGDLSDQTAGKLSNSKTLWKHLLQRKNESTFQWLLS